MAAVGWKWRHGAHAQQLLQNELSISRRERVSHPSHVVWYYISPWRNKLVHLHYSRITVARNFYIPLIGVTLDSGVSLAKRKEKVVSAPCSYIHWRKIFFVSWESRAYTNFSSHQAQLPVPPFFSWQHGSENKHLKYYNLVSFKLPLGCVTCDHSTNVVLR